MSAGIRSGVNWMRLNEQSMTSAIVRTSIVLPRPGTPSSSAWRVGEEADQHLPDEVVLAHDDRSISARMPSRPVGEVLDGELGGRRSLECVVVWADQSPPSVPSSDAK